jgi:alkaline phosphatase
MTIWMKNVIAAILLPLLCVLGTNVFAQTENSPQVKGIILLIGDGMGLNQVRSAEIYAKHVMNNSLAINSILTRGTTTTYSANSEITDSSSAATALYTGHKINNGVLNMLPDGRVLFTIGDAAKKAGLSVGVVSTTRLTHATPAAIYSRARHRNCEDYIAEQLPEFSPEVALGGGRQYFVPQNVNGSKRKDSTNLIETMMSKGYEYVTNKKELSAISPKTDKLFGLFSGSHMDYSLDRENDPKLANQPSLAEMTKAALSILEKNPKGFFLMVEGGRIDHACHAHDIKSSIYEVLDFDSAVNVALEFQATRPSILVIVTADHETGGLGLGRGSEYALDVEALKPIKHSLEYLAKEFKADPSKAEDLLKKAGFELTEKERDFLLRDPSTIQVAELNTLPKIKDKVSWMHFALSSIESERSKIGWTSFAHTAQPVITWAIGPGEAEFSGSYDNTDIAKRMTKLLGLTLTEPAAPNSENESKCQTPKK